MTRAMDRTMRSVGFVLLVCGCFQHIASKPQNSAASVGPASANGAAATTSSAYTADDNLELELFREYLRIPSVHPNIDYTPVVEYLQRQADSLDLPVRLFYPANQDNPMVVLTWTGSQPDLPSIILNSHMDVVAVYPDQWTHPPFGADIDDQGNIYARGAQDMKAAGAQYLGAVRALKQSGIKQFKRTIHLVYAADEETRDGFGWEAFVNTDDFRSLNIGFVLDEGGSSETETIEIYYAERNGMRVYIDCAGESAHAASLPDDTAAEKCEYMINRMYRMRRFESMRLKTNKTLKLGDVSSINLTILKGGVQDNVIPGLISLVFDVRLTPSVKPKQFMFNVNQWAREAGPNVTVTFDSEEGEQLPTVVGPSNPYWVAVEDGVRASNLTPIASVMPATLDGRFIRRAQLPALGFSPVVNTIGRQHADNEYISTDTYLKGITVFQRIINNLGNV